MAEIKLTRVDYRLVHGQVVTQWVKICGADRIVIVNDELAADEFMADIYRMSAPAGVSVEVRTIEQACEEYKANAFGNGKLLVLFKCVEDALAAVRGGVELADVQIGGLGGGAGTMTAFGIAFRPSDVDAMKALDQEGVHVHVHVVPAQQDVELPDLINKLGF